MLSLRRRSSIGWSHLWLRRESKGTPRATIARNQQGGFSGPPGAGSVRERVGVGSVPNVEDHLDEAPRGLDRVAAHEERLVAHDNVAEQSLVSLRRRGLIVEIDIYRIEPQRLSGNLRNDVKGEAFVGLNANREIVRG